MKIRVLGCDGGSLPGSNPVTFLINGHLTVDAGSLTSTLPIKDLHKIREILITHSHLDHIRDLGFLADNLFLSGKQNAVTLYSSETILTDLKKNIFNGIIWPDMTKIPPEKPILRMQSIKKPLIFNGLTIQAIPVTHSHASLGFIISDKKSAVVFSGDTASTDELWKQANRLKNLKAVFIETSFPAALSDIAYQSRHLSTLLLERELKKIKKTNIPIYVYHLKPLYFKKISNEIKKLGNRNLKILKSGSILIF